ncbi:histone H1-binding protein [Colletotrichum karsti]|uniref:Histone H1-binding protein n=1 Tax=Colletotrichum karsti TaxID=1095194 RepID=A0A9P6IIS3_9PEZI|nr:histone H1-binding protein [Colletotrichum karsti]KAF9882216.1 histone H1-binding protein [Colletotrichum karsti]
MADTTEQPMTAAEVPVAEAPAPEAPVAVADPIAKPDAPVQQDTPATTGGEESEEDINSKKVTLADWTAKGTALYAKKQYEEAADCFTKAAELQSEINGDLNPQNAEILFLYGRSIFKIGQSKSDVLGGKSSSEKKVEKPTPKAKKAAPAAPVPAATADAPAETEANRITEEGIAIVASETAGAKTEETVEEKKPLFQFTGDENFDESDEEEDEGEGDAEDEEDDDLANAFHILDLAARGFRLQLERLEKEEPNGKAEEQINADKSTLRHIKERLADIYDLLAEISLENERYPDAIEDSRKSLKFKKELYTNDNEIIAEAHFKLSLALEFASVTAEAGENAEKQAFDEKLREEAANELEAAINSTKAKLQNKEVELATMASPEDNEVTRATITDVKDMIADMEQRLEELRKPPIDINAALGGEAMGGILGAALGESAEQTQARIEEAKKTATDLTSLVRKKNKEEPKPAEPQANGENGTKRKAEEPAEDESSKKAKVEEPTAEA